MRRNSLLVLLMTSVVGAIALAGAAPAQASVAAECDPNIGSTIKDGNYIKGSGSLPCSGQATVVLQRQRWYGWGEELDSVILSGAGDARTVLWNCSGAGTYTYRTYVSWRTIGGRPGFKESNHLRVAC